MANKSTFVAKLYDLLFLAFLIPAYLFSYPRFLGQMSMTKAYMAKYDNDGVARLIAYYWENVRINFMLAALILGMSVVYAFSKPTPRLIKFIIFLLPGIYLAVMTLTYRLT